MRQPLNQFVKTALKEEFKNKALDGLYEEVITGLTYHSCAIEGNRLSLKEVTDLLYTNCETITGSVGYRIRDIEDVRGNFDLFRVMLETLDSPLTPSLLKQWHKEYAMGVWTYRDYNYPIGEYRKYYRRVCGHEVCPVYQIAYELEHALDDYNHSARALLDIVKLHCKFLVIHPFQGGNGFLARMLTFRECLHNECTPFIIPVESMYEYFSAIDAYAETGDYTPMKDLCDKLQAQFIIMLQQMKQ